MMRAAIVVGGWLLFVAIVYFGWVRRETPNGGVAADE